MVMYLHIYHYPIEAFNIASHARIGNAQALHVIHLIDLPWCVRMYKIG